MSAKSAKIIDLQEQRRARQAAQPSINAPMLAPSPFAGFAWVPVFVMPVVMFGPNSSFA